MKTTNTHSFPVKVASESDYVHDVTYNFYGTQLALCTSSQTISIWSRKEDDEAGWTETGKIQDAHSAPIWRLDWAHPEFGSVIASCSEDRTISIWSYSQEKWRKRATLTDSPHAVTDVQFAPRFFGLKFAACTVDGIVRIYEASDPLNLSVWEVEDFSDSGACAALSWCACETQRLAVVGQTGKLKVYERTNRWHLAAETLVNDGAPLKDCAWAPNLCREAEWIACCGDSPNVAVYAFNNQSLVCVHRIDTAVSPIWRCAWSITGDVLSLAPESGKVQLWRLAGLGVAIGWEQIRE